MGEEQVEEKQKLPTMPSDLIVSELSSRQVKRARIDQVDEDMSSSSVDCLIQYMEGRFNATE